MLTYSYRAGISYAEFWEMTPREWEACMDGFKMREDAEYTKFKSIYTLIFNCHSKDSMSIDDLFGDNIKKEIKPMDYDEMDRLRKKWKLNAPDELYIA